MTDRGNLAVSLKGEGKTYREIGSLLGISFQRAEQLVRREITGRYPPSKLSIIYPKREEKPRRDSDVLRRVKLLLENTINPRRVRKL